MPIPIDASSERLTRRTLAALAFVILWALLLGATGPEADRDLPRRFDSAGTALEAAESQEELTQVTGEPNSESWKAFRAQTKFDLVFPFGYAAAFAGMGLLLRRRDCRACRITGTAALIFGVAAGLFDLGENLVILNSVSTPVEFSPWLHRFSCAKWVNVGVASLSAATLWMTPFPLELELKVWSWVAAVAFLTAGVLCLVGAVWAPAWERVDLPLAIGWFVAATILAVRRRRFLEVV